MPIKSNILLLPYEVTEDGPTIHDAHLKDLYRRIELEGSAKWVFYGGGIESEDQFLRFVKNPTVSTLIVTSKDGYHPLAVAFLDGFREKTAFAHFVFFKETWGKTSLEIGKEALKILFSSGSLQMLYGIIPLENAIAVRFTERLGGFRMTPDLPKGAWNGKTQKPMPAVMFYFVGDNSDEDI